MVYIIVVQVEYLEPDLTPCLVGQCTLSLFEIDAGMGEAVVEISAKMVRARDGSIAAGRIFEARTPVASVSEGETVGAIDMATGRVLRDITGWAASVH